jgi:hypothetical protein
MSSLLLARRWKLVRVAGRDVCCDVWTVVEEYRISLLQPK